MKWVNLGFIGAVIMLFSALGWKLYHHFSWSEHGAALPKVQGKLFYARPLGHFQVLNQRGELVDNSVFKDKWTLLSYGYLRCPDVCPTTLMVKRSVQTLLAEQQQNIELAFLSIDPVNDKPEHLQQYLQYFGDNITGLTPTSAQTDYQNLLKDLAIRANTIDDNQFLSESQLNEQQDEGSSQGLVTHGIHLFLINPHGDLQAVFFPKILPTVELPQFSAAQITNDIIIAISFFDSQNEVKGELVSKLR